MGSIIKEGGKTMQTNPAETYSISAEDIIVKLRSGQDHLRSFLIEQYRGYIISVAAKVTGKTSQSNDEFSIALQAFNEAIDSFDPQKNSSFLGFSGMVINRRLIDYMRKNSKFSAEYPFTYFEAEDDDDFAENIASEKSHLFTQNIEIQEELMNFKKNLLLFGITLEDLVRLAPKHADTKLLCINAAQVLADSKDLSTKLLKDKKLPISELMQNSNASRKTFEKHRKYIIALYLVLCSDMDIIKGYVGFFTKGVTKR
jgi:RNA polymerase sigma factor